jgi:hypothetical protein
MSKKFSDLIQLTTPATNDILPIDDVSAGSTKKITVSDLLRTSGGLTAAYMSNPYKFRAHPTSDQSGIAASTWSTVTLGTEDYDTGSNFASSTFTAPVAGFYQFNVVVSTTGLGGTLLGEIAVRLFKNGTTQVSCNGGSFDNNWTMDFSNISLSDCIQLAAGDTIIVQVFEILSSGTGGVSATNSFFSGHLVSAT